MVTVSADARRWPSGRATTNFSRAMGRTASDGSLDRRPEDADVEFPGGQGQFNGRRQHLGVDVQHHLRKVVLDQPRQDRKLGVGRGPCQADAKGSGLSVCKPARPAGGFLDASEDRCASTRNASPAGVSLTLLVVRAKSSAPSSASNCRICWDSGGWAICRRSAAWPKWHVSATHNEIAQVPQFHDRPSLFLSHRWLFVQQRRPEFSIQQISK